MDEFAKELAANKTNQTENINVPEELKQNYSQVISDFKDGKLHWKDIANDKVQKIGKETLNAYN